MTLKPSFQRTPQHSNDFNTFLARPLEHEKFFQDRPDLSDNQQFMAQCIEQDWRCFDYASERLKNKKDFLLAHLPNISKNKGDKANYVWERIPEKLKTDNDFLFQLVTLGDTKNLAKLTPISFRENQEILLKMIPIDGISVLSVIGDNHPLLSNFDFAKKCVSIKYASILWFKDPAIQESAELLLIGLKENMTRSWQIFTITDSVKEDYKRDWMTSKTPSFFQQALINTIKMEPWRLRQIFTDLGIDKHLCFKDIKRFLVSQDYENIFKVLNPNKESSVFYAYNKDVMEEIISKVRTPLLKIASTARHTNKDFKVAYTNELARRKLLDIKQGGSAKASKVMKEEQENKLRSRRTLGKP